MTVSRSHVAAGVAMLALALATPSASAQRHAPTPAEAAYERGLAALRANRYGDAVLALEDSYRTAPVPAVLFNLGLAYRGAGRHLAAVETLSRYLHDEGAAVPAERRAAVERAIGELRAGLGTIDCHVAPASAVVTLDGRPAACGPEPILVDPGEHVLEARADGFAHERRALRLDGGARAAFRVELVRNAPPPEPAPRPAIVVLDDPSRRPAQVTPDAPVYTRWWFWTAIGVAATGVVVAAVVLANQSPRDPSLDTLFNAQALDVH